MAKNKRRLLMQALIVVSVASLLYVYEYFMRVLPGALSYQLMDELHVQAGALGIISAAFFYAYTPMQVPAGLLCDRFGPKRCLIAAMVICTAAAALFALAYSASFAFISRLLLGFGAAFAFVCPVVLASRWFDRRHFAMVTGLIQVMGCIGAILGGAPMVHLSSLFGWRPTVHGFVWVGGLLVLLFILFIRQRPSNLCSSNKSIIFKTECFCQSIISI
jgi:MFS family permease